MFPIFFQWRWDILGGSSIEDDPQVFHWGSLRAAESKCGAGESGQLEGGIISGMVVGIDGYVRGIRGRVVGGVGWDHDEISGGVRDLGPINRVVLLVRGAAIAGLAGYLFRG